jgi:hypothetical protein
MIDEWDWSDCSAAAERYLADSTSVAALLLGAGDRVERANGAFVAMAGLRAGPVGAVLTELVAPASSAAAARLLDGVSPAERLQFSAPGGTVFVLTCRLYAAGERRLLLGDAFAPTETEVMRTMTQLHGEVINLGRDLDRRNRELQRALDEIKALHGILPICMFCKRIRDDVGSWHQLEKFIADRSDAKFSHGLCDECSKEHWPDEGP